MSPPLLLGGRVGYRLGGQQLPGVVMDGIGEEVLGALELDEAAPVHHPDPIAQVADK